MLQGFQVRFIEDKQDYNQRKTSDTFMDLPGYLENIEHSIKNTYIE